VACIFSGQSLETRQKNIDLFRDDHIKILISTELMARGIDIPNLPVVVNYDVPHIPEEYLHRIGRTGRAGKEGFAITLVAKDSFPVTVAQYVTEINEKEYILNIEKLLEKKYPLVKYLDLGEMRLKVTNQIH